MQNLLSLNIQGLLRRWDFLIASCRTWWFSKPGAKVYWDVSITDNTEVVAILRQPESKRMLVIKVERRKTGRDL